MAALYVTSTQTFSGKSAFCVGIALQLRRDGFKIGYMKPLITGVRLAAGLTDEDAEFFQNSFGLSEPLEDMIPVGLGPRTVQAILEGVDRTDYPAKLRAAYGRISAGCDVVIMEGGCNLQEGFLVDLPAPRVASMLSAKVLVVVKYSDELQVLEDVLGARPLLGDLLIGAVLNAIPRQQMPFVQETVKPALEARGIPVLAVLPQERLLLSVSVGDLVEFLSGKVLCCTDKMDELVEHLMVGAMGVDSALSYFRRKPNKAVITGGDRPDIQLAALETSTKCVILTGNLRPSPIILARAEEVGVPMIVVLHDTITTVEVIERFFGKTRFHLEKKVHRFEEMLGDRFDFGRLYDALALKRS
jgi:hypothetical protein